MSSKSSSPSREVLKCTIPVKTIRFYKFNLQSKNSDDSYLIDLNRCSIVKNKKISLLDFDGFADGTVLSIPGYDIVSSGNATGTFILSRRITGQCINYECCDGVVKIYFFAPRTEKCIEMPEDASITLHFEDIASLLPMISPIVLPIVNDNVKVKVKVNVEAET
jgi:hypothetical protein